MRMIVLFLLLAMGSIPPARAGDLVPCIGRCAALTCGHGVNGKLDCGFINGMPDEPSTRTMSQMLCRCVSENCGITTSQRYDWCYVGAFCGPHGEAISAASAGYADDADAALLVKAGNLGLYGTCTDCHYYGICLHR